MSNIVKDVFKDYKGQGNILEAQIENINLFKKSKKIEIKLLTEKQIKIQEISSFEEYLKTRFQIQKVELYIEFGEKGVTDHPDMAGMMEAISQGNREGIQKKIKNVFEEWVPEMQPIILEIMERLKEKGAKCVGMSGSGPTVFVLTDSAEELKGLEKIVQPLGTTWICKTLSAEEIQ